MLRCGHLINDTQHGFLPEKSCTTQMVDYIDSLAESINRSSRTDAIYFDFAKAFDSVNHDILLSKLKSQYGIDGLLLKFIVNYLKGRKQKVVIGGHESSLKMVNSGVPQGSILGPLLFVLFINDMKLKVTSSTHIALYADDTKIWREIREYLDHLILQNDISALLQWSIDNKMSFHPAKCKVLKVTRQTEKFMDKFPYRLGNTYLEYMNQDKQNEKEKFEKDLGIIVTPNLMWDTHCEMLIRRANSRLGLTKRTCHFVKNRKQRLVLYQTMVRSIFQHCAEV